MIETDVLYDDDGRGGGGRGGEVPCPEDMYLGTLYPF